MIKLQLSELADKMDGTILQGVPSSVFDHYSIDSRQIKKGSLFFALKDKRDGHAFIPDAVKNGAKGVVVSEQVPLVDNKTAYIKVGHTLNALQRLAHQVLLKHPVQVIGITGSTGKTTTKEFTAALLKNTHCVLKSHGNFNNHIGLPLSLLYLNKKHDTAVLEYGMSHPGEILALTRIASPDVAVICNVYPVHMEFFENINEIAKAKKEILDGMNPNGTAVLNGDQPLVLSLTKSLKNSPVLFGLTDKCDVRAYNIHVHSLEKMSFDFQYKGREARTSIPFSNRGYLYNFLAAAAAASVLSVPFEHILKTGRKLKPPDNRGEVLALANNIKVINDTYNSNPAALKEAIKSLSLQKGGRKIAVLGDMLELGEKQIAYHTEAGKFAAKNKIDLLITVGPLAKYIAEGALISGMAPENIISFEQSEEAADKIPSILNENDFVLIKGSRGVKTEKIVNVLKKEGK
ncbi:MAG: UDP-N-acetylmuramoyl-tripeptide--D-alanyl-D-alanine ligase [Acidobacteriota bacterium]